jgi:phosphatidylglycerophosphatase A
LDLQLPEGARETPAAARWLALVLATGAGAGLSPVVPGTVGSAVGVLLYLPLAGLGAALYLLTALALVALGIWAAELAERAFAGKDDRRIVIDEVAGQLLALFPLVALAPPEALRSPVWLVTGLVAFRVLDVWKPGPVRWAERNFRGGAGVVLDDVIAGLFVAALLAAGLLMLE